MKVYPALSCVVLNANFHPDQGKLSADRWDIKWFGNEEMHQLEAVRSYGKITSHRVNERFYPIKRVVSSHLDNPMPVFDREGRSFVKCVMNVYFV